MASGIYLPALTALAKGKFDFSSDTFKVMLVTDAYTPDFDAHDFRNDVTNEVSGTGYTAGGAGVTVSVSAPDTGNDRQDVSLGGAAWPGATITARGAVYYKSRGGAATADEIIAYVDFGGDVSATAGTFTLTASTLRLAL